MIRLFRLTKQSTKLTLTDFVFNKSRSSGTFLFCRCLPEVLQDLM
jgi:hypothetical protein